MADRAAMLLFALLAVGQSDLAAECLRDVAALPPRVQQHTRYLTLEGVDTAKRPLAIKVMAGHLQHLSTESDITPPKEVGDDLLRVDIRDYGWARDTWEQLADADPYHHVRIELGPRGEYEWVVYAGNPTQAFLLKSGQTLGGYDLEKQHYLPYLGADQWGPATALVPVPVPYTKLHAGGAEGKLVTATAPWLPPATMARLCTVTQSRAPILRATWLFNQTAAAQNRKPNYYDFLRIRNLQDFEKRIGFDEKLATGFGQTLLEAVARSGVTPNARGIYRENTVGGGYWKSADFKRTKGDRDPLRIQGEEIFKNPDAIEAYGHLPNGFWATIVANGKGVLQDAAPGDIASDNRSKSNDHQVHVNASCVRCHTKGGLHDVDGWYRNLFQPPLALQNVDEDKLRVLRQQYVTRRLEPFLERDRRRYREAVHDATGLTAEKYAEVYGWFWEHYEDAKVDLAWAARDCGVSPEVLRSAIDRQLKITGSVDPVLSVLLLEGNRARSISIRDWESTYHLAMMALVQAKGNVGVK